MTDPTEPTEDDGSSNETEPPDPAEPNGVEAVHDEGGEELGEVAGGGEITDLGGDSPSS
jgi:hypothetical protein